MAASENANELELERGIISNVQTFSAVFKRIFLKVCFCVTHSETLQIHSKCSTVETLMRMKMEGQLSTLEMNCLKRA